ncbi:MAG TPA: hypothetical protein VNA32_10425, partial [Actinomycetota bacterium]|nr:hypothetical protein [Actinomycetota bacterium]
ATDLTTLVEALKRELAVPGEFDTVFPNTSDDDLAAALADAVAEAQLDGFFGGNTVDPAALTVTPALSSGAMALVVIYAGIRSIRSQLRNMKTHVKYEAAGVSYETETAASVLTQELKDFRDRKDNLLALILRQSRAGSAVQVMDGYLIRSRGYFPVAYSEFGTFYVEEVTGLAFLNGF